MAESLVTRFAPSPTGYLHLGHLAHMIYVWGAARVLSSRVLLRIEDHDRQRSRAKYEQAILDDMDWLGLEPTNQLSNQYRQSDSERAYEDALASLHGVYRCRCSRKDLAAHSHSSLTATGERRYNGFCRDKDWTPDTEHGLRIRLEPGVEQFVDDLLGPQSQDPSEQCGDLLIRDRHNNWTYQYAVVVDDIRHGVNLVIRGEDLLSSTGRQIRLARLLGDPTPRRWLHHPLITDDFGAKLSKSQQATPIRALRSEGMNAESVLGLAAFRVGLIPESRPTSLAELTDRLIPFLQRRDN